MVFPIPDVWTRDSVDARRDEEKRTQSPCSFFFSQGQGLVLAAQYFVDARLAPTARGGVALKHRHKIHLALFGQLMASFEYLLKDFVAKAIDQSAVLDARVQAAKWIEVSAAKVLANRLSAASPGAMLIHSTLGWHSADIVNQRYQDLFGRQPVAASELPTLTSLWVMRHSVAHNAGFVTHFDASRIGSMALAEHVANIDAPFISDTFEFLKPIARRVAVVGDVVLLEWLRTLRQKGADFTRDSQTYVGLKKLATMVESRNVQIVDATEAEYLADFARV